MRMHPLATTPFDRLYTGRRGGQARRTIPTCDLWHISDGRDDLDVGSMTALRYQGDLL